MTNLQFTPFEAESRRPSARRNFKHLRVVRKPQSGRQRCVEAFPPPSPTQRPFSMHEPYPHAHRASPSAASEDETLPEVGPVSHETSRVGRFEVVVQLLGDVHRTLEAMPDGKARRMLKRKVETFHFAVDCWGAIPPRAEQLKAMLETLLQLQEAVLEAHALAR